MRTRRPQVELNVGQWQWHQFHYARSYLAQAIAFIILVSIARRPHHAHQSVNQTQCRSRIPERGLQRMQGVDRVAGANHQQTVEQGVHEPHLSASIRILQLCVTSCSCCVSSDGSVSLSRASLLLLALLYFSGLVCYCLDDRWWCSISFTRDSSVNGHG